MRCRALFCGWLSLLLLSAPGWARRDEPPHPVSVALADFQVSGLGQPRYWLGPVYSEVLLRRLLKCRTVLPREPLEARQNPPSVAPRDLETLKAWLLTLATKLDASFVIGGLIEDKGETLTITPVVVSRERGGFQALSLDVDTAHLFDPQVTVIVMRYLPNVGARPTADEMLAMQTYTPDLPLDQLALVGNGWRQYAPENPGRSLETWQLLLEGNPVCELAETAVASVSHYWRRRLQDRELAYYRRQADLGDPENPLVFLRLGELYEDLARWPEAEGCYKRALELRSTFMAAYLGLGRARLHQGLWQAALLAFDSALVLEPENTLALLNRGVVLYRRGNVSDAVTAWQQVLAIDPENATAKNYLSTYSRGTITDAP